MTNMNSTGKLTHVPNEVLSAEALKSLPAAFQNAEFCCALGEQALKEGRFEAALDFFQKAVELDSGSAHGWFGQGMANTNMKEYAASLDFFRKVLELNPKLAIAHHNLGRSMHEIGQADLAYQSFQKSINLGFDETRRDVAITIPGVPSASNQAILTERKKWADGLLRIQDNKRKNSAPIKDRGKPCLKVGYVSAFFHKENWMKPVWGLINQHDRQKFQIHLFSDHTKLTPAIENILEPGDCFHDISDLSDEQAAARIAAVEIDILVDLNGYSYPERFPVFLRRPAPLTVGWFNMYATTGFDCFDYLIGDDCVIPANEESFYTEQIIRVPGSYLTFSVAYNVPEVSEPPCIDNGFITFGSLISQYKITDQVIESWCQILNRSPDSRILIRNAALGKLSNRKYLRSQFADRGIPPERVSLEGPASHFEFLETYSRIDIALDAFPYNGGTTTTEAIWQGVPVVAFWGDRWVSRTSATLLRAADLDEMVAQDLPGYMLLATQLASDCDKLANLRRNMRKNLMGSKACDTVAFARSMEQLYREIWEK
jgi:protein O-GlcNAc transferase